MVEFHHEKSPNPPVPFISRVGFRRAEEGIWFAGYIWGVVSWGVVKSPEKVVGILAGCEAFLG